MEIFWLIIVIMAAITYLLSFIALIDRFDKIIDNQEKIQYLLEKDNNGINNK